MQTSPQPSVRTFPSPLRRSLVPTCRHPFQAQPRQPLNYFLSVWFTWTFHISALRYSVGFYIWVLSFGIFLWFIWYWYFVLFIVVEELYSVVLTNHVFFNHCFTSWWPFELFPSFSYCAWNVILIEILLKWLFIPAKWTLKEQLVWLLCLYSKWAFIIVIVWNKME